MWHVIPLLGAGCAKGFGDCSYQELCLELSDKDSASNRELLFSVSSTLGSLEVVWVAFRSVNLAGCSCNYPYALSGENVIEYCSLDLRSPCKPQYNDH